MEVAVLLVIARPCGGPEGTGKEGRKEAVRDP